MILPDTSLKRDKKFGLLNWDYVWRIGAWMVWNLATQCIMYLSKRCRPNVRATPTSARGAIWKISSMTPGPITAAWWMTHGFPYCTHPVAVRCALSGLIWKSWNCSDHDDLDDIILPKKAGKPEDCALPTQSGVSFQGYLCGFNTARYLGILFSLYWGFGWPKPWYGSLRKGRFTYSSR